MLQNKTYLTIETCFVLGFAFVSLVQNRAHRDIPSYLMNLAVFFQDYIERGLKNKKRHMNQYQTKLKSWKAKAGRITVSPADTEPDSIQPFKFQLIEIFVMPGVQNLF